MVFTLSRRVVQWGIFFVLAVAVSVVTLPSFFTWYEHVGGAPLPYEGVIRFLFFSIFLLLIVGAGAWLLLRGKWEQWVLWWVMAFSFLSLVLVFFADTANRLMEEFSWIRYTTAAFLLFASLTALCIAAWYFRERRTSLMLLWVLGSGALLYAALDEVLEIHEAIGRFLQQAGGLPPFVTDLVTVAYAVVTLLVLVFSFRMLRMEYGTRYRLFVTTLFLGGVVYFFSTMFDTVDIIVGKKMHALANILSLDPMFVFSDIWSFFWAPRNFFNGLEEVFEHMAASLFFASFVLLLLAKWAGEPWMASFTVRRRNFARGITFFVIAVVVGAFFASLPLTFGKRSPVSPLFASTRLAGYFDGLRHTDDLFYHPAWGVLIANEGRGNIYQWKDERWRELPDPEKRLRDTDSVTADKEAVYVSDGTRGVIARYTTKEGWQDSWTRADGLKHPEGIVAAEGALYVIDESERSVTRLIKGKKPEIWKPSHALWQAPEGIAYDAVSKRLLITDDVSGAVFLVDFGKALTLLAKLENPEDITITSDSRIFITDNGWGAIFALTADGSLKKFLQFGRSYRDVQGITFDDEGNLYVVTADGFGSVSFMPSFLFRINI